MKNFFIVVMLTFLYVPSVYAGLYLGVKGGEMNISDGIPFNDATSVGILLGTNVQDSGLAIEGELTTTVSAAEHKTISGSELDIYTLAFYGVYRSAGSFYIKGKAGLIYEYLNISSFIFPLEGEDIGISLGVGGGFRISNSVNLELEYTLIESDIDYISLGMTFKF